MEIMYRCSMCKKNFKGEPSRRLGNGYKLMFCQDCDEETKKRSLAATSSRTQIFESGADFGNCSWCGIKKTPENTSKHNFPHRGPGLHYICKKCDEVDRRLVALVQITPAIAKRVENLEIKYSEQRQRVAAEERRKQEEAAKQKQLESLPTAEHQIESDQVKAKINKLEAMMEKLITALGGV